MVLKKDDFNTMRQKVLESENPVITLDASYIKFPPSSYIVECENSVSSVIVSSISFLALNNIIPSNMITNITQITIIFYLFLKEKNILIGYVNIWHENNITYDLQNIFKTPSNMITNITQITIIFFFIHIPPR